MQEAFPSIRRVSLEASTGPSTGRGPRFVRVDADETSYGLHIILRFELEQELISGTARRQDLPEAWNARFEELLGLAVPNDRLGVLQDVHWSGGGFGYFPTYLLGNVLSVQIWDKARAAIPDVDAQIERGEFGELHDWLRENIYALGRKFTPAETIERVVGGPIDPEPYLRYLARQVRALAPPTRGRRLDDRAASDGDRELSLRSRASTRSSASTQRASNDVPAPSRSSAIAARASTRHGRPAASAARRRRRTPRGSGCRARSRAGAPIVDIRYPSSRS